MRGKAAAVSIGLLAVALFAGCAQHQKIVPYSGITEDRYPRIDVTPYEEEFSDMTARTFRELSPEKSEETPKGDYLLRYF